jgi:hypothetical protein
VDPSTSFLHEDEVTALHYKLVATSLSPVGDVDVQATVSMEQGTEMGVCARMNSAGDGYCFAISWGGGTYPQIGKFSGGNQNPAGIASARASYPISQNVDYVVKLRVQGNSIFGKIYQAGTSEPAAWTVQTTDGLFASGLVGFYAYGSQPLIKSVTVTPLASTVSVQSTVVATSPATVATSTTATSTTVQSTQQTTIVSQPVATTTSVSGVSTTTPASGSATTTSLLSNSLSETADMLNALGSVLNALRLNL